MCIRDSPETGPPDGPPDGIGEKEWAQFVARVHLQPGWIDYEVDC